jgi:hypothetical protein
MRDKVRSHAGSSDGKGVSKVEVRGSQVRGQCRRDLIVVFYDLSLIGSIGRVEMALSD